jgi:hypothetical protein
MDRKPLLPPSASQKDGEREDIQRVISVSQLRANKKNDSVLARGQPARTAIGSGTVLTRLVCNQARQVISRFRIFSQAPSSVGAVLTWKRPMAGR